MNVRAKFRVESKTQTASGYEVKMHTVYAGTEENDKYFNATPYGEITMGILNEAAAAQFVPGQYYYVDFTQTD